MSTTPFVRKRDLARSNVASETCLFLNSSLVKSNTVSFVGKTGLMISLARKAVQNGYRALFIKAQDLLVLRPDPLCVHGLCSRRSRHNLLCACAARFSNGSLEIFHFVPIRKAQHNRGRSGPSKILRSGIGQ
jgi:hypothetical protein